MAKRWLMSLLSRTLFLVSKLTRFLEACTFAIAPPPMTTAVVIEGGAIAKVEASRVLPAEAEAEDEAEVLITTLVSTLTGTGPANACPFPCRSNAQCQAPTCRRTRCAHTGRDYECVG